MSTILEFNFIQCRVHQGVGELILDRAEKHNAFDDVMIGEMLQALHYLSGSNDCQLLVLKAKGKNFSAGADLGWMRKQANMDFEQNLNDAKQLAELMSILDDFPKPTLALVQGAAFGGALGLICCCDVAIATNGARFCLSEVKLGLIPAVISPYVVRAMGARNARRYMLTAEVFSSDTAQKLHVVHEINDSLELAAVPIMTALKNNSPQAMTWVKTLVKHLEDGQINPATHDYTSERIARIRVSKEGQEGLNAFFDKRTPDWKVGTDPQGNP